MYLGVSEIFFLQNFESLSVLVLVTGHTTHILKQTWDMKRQIDLIEYNNYYLVIMMPSHYLHYNFKYHLYDRHR